MIYYRAMEKKGIINRERELPHTAEIMGVGCYCMCSWYRRLESSAIWSCTLGSSTGKIIISIVSFLIVTHFFPPHERNRTVAK